MARSGHGRQDQGWISRRRHCRLPPVNEIAAIVYWDGRPVATERRDLLLPAPAARRRWLGKAGAALGQAGPVPPCRDDGILLAWDARIDNREELLHALGRPPETDDGGLILAAYRRWGDACPRRLTGDFAFVLWDGGRRSLLAARDGLGMRPLDWLAVPGGILLASGTAPLLEYAALPRRFDPLAVAGWISGWPDPDRALLAPVARVPAGHLLRADRRGVRLQRFWDIDPERRIRYRRPEEYRQHLRSLLQRAVADRLRSGAGVVASQMSGGMDSTTVTALARESLAAAGKRLLVVSHSYDSVASCDETERIRETLRHLEIREARFLAAEQHLDLDYRALYPPHPDSPGTVLSPRYRDEMRLLREAGAEVLLTGSGGDEMTWGHSLSYSRRLRRGELGVVLEVIRGCRELELPLLRTLRQLFLAPLAPPWLRRALGRPAGASRLPDWVPAAAIRRLDLDERLPGASRARFRNPVLQARYEALRHTSTFNSVRSYDRVGMEHGIEVRHPFFDTRLAEFSFAIPDDLWIRNGYPKWLLRRAMDGVLPDSVCWNRHKVVFDDFFGRLLREQAQAIRAILADRRLEQAGLLDTDRLLAHFDRVVSGRQGFTVDLLYVLMTQVWLQQHF